MKIEKLSATAELISSVAIVVTLAYLAIQAQQTNAMLLGNSRQAMLQADLSFLTMALDYPEEAGNLMGEGVSYRREFSMLTTLVRGREFAWFQYQNGIMDERAFDSYMSPLYSILASESGRASWAASKGGLDPDFVAFVDARLVRD